MVKDMNTTTTQLALASILFLTSTACIETDPPPQPQQAEQPDEGSAAPKDERENHPDPTAHRVETEADEQVDPPDSLTPGPITGSWKLVRVETGDQIGQFSLAQAEGDPVLDGSYAMRYGLNRYFDGVSGELTSGRVDGNTANFTFNPTPNAEQRFHVELEREGDAWTGELWAELDPERERMPVRMVPLNR
jgi:hypothetical protein